MYSVRQWAVINSKNLRNGPCEVKPEIPCVWVEAWRENAKAKALLNQTEEI